MTISEILSHYRPLLAKAPKDFQLKLLWLLLETIATDTDQLKAYVDALHESFMRYAGAVESYSTSHKSQSESLNDAFQSLLGELD